MIIKVLLVTGKDFQSKEESGELLDQWVQFVDLTQDIHYSTHNFVRVTWESLVLDALLGRSMDKWNCNID